MEASRLIQAFGSPKQENGNQTRYFFLEHVLKARADLHLETGKHVLDQEINVYISGLLNSLIESASFVQQKPYISSFDIDIRNYLEKNPGRRNEYIVYRDNADFGLMILGLFLKYNHRGSYHHIVLSENQEHGRVALYYSLAASALAHLRGTNASLVSVFSSISDQMEEIVQILRRAAGTYFDLMEKISDGSMYHLEKELDENSNRVLFNKKIDEFLKVYSEYKEKATDDLKERLLNLTDELRKLNSDFKFDITAD